MRTLRLTLAVVLVVSGFVRQPGIGAVDTTDTKLLSEPAISAIHIAFIYREGNRSPRARSADASL